jgi:hypothetical protein
VDLQKSYEIRRIILGGPTRKWEYNIKMDIELG